jgi:hypothetical protein
MPSGYQQFVKAHMAKLPAHMSAKEKMVEIGKMWREQSGTMSKAKKAPAKRATKKEKGGSLLGSLIPFGSMLGLGLEEKAKKGKKAKKAPMRRRKAHKAPMMEQEEHAGSIFGDIIPFGNMLGLGLENKPKRGRKVKGGVISGAGVSGGVMSAAGLRTPKHLSSPIRGHSIHQNPEHMRAGSFGDMFFKGLTMPFRVASAIPIPGLQQIGTVGSKVFDALGV